MPNIELTATDGHKLAAFRATPEQPRGALVVAQEIFGVNAHIRAVVARYAGMGYDTIAPALFDRIERDVELGYDDEGFTQGRALTGELEAGKLLFDLEAARDAVASAGKVGIVGYCLGGAIVWSAAGKLAGLAAGVSYYGSRIKNDPDLAPKIPVLMHVGEHDASFPIETVREIASRYPSTVTMHAYDAGHGFNCDHRADFQPDAAALALARTLEFFATHLA